MYTQFDVESHNEGKIQIAFLNQPKSLNALNKSSIKELTLFIESFSKDETARCLVISGRGNAFCSGQNLEEALSGPSSNDTNVIKNIVTDYYNPLVKAISNCRKPVISLINGPAVGAGAMLALICDFSLAKESAYISQAFVKIGLIPDTGGTYYLPKLLGRQLANYLTFTGKKLSAQEAKSLGLVAEVFPDAEFDEKAMEILLNISELPTKAISLTKKAFLASYDNTLEKQLDLEAKLQQTAANSEDFVEGVQAFLGKRKPIYKGK